MRERRRHCRIPLDAAIDLTWTESGETKVARGRYIDISAGGMRVQSPSTIPQGTEVELSARQIGFVGAASVRYAAPFGENYILGLELSERTVQEIFGFSDREAV
jgi:hypothetical protein